MYLFGQFYKIRGYGEYLHVGNIFSILKGDQCLVLFIKPQEHFLESPLFGQLHVIEQMLNFLHDLNILSVQTQAEVKAFVVGLFNSGRKNCV